MNIDICKKCEYDCVIFNDKDNNYLMKSNGSFFMRTDDIYNYTTLEHRNNKWIRTKNEGKPSCLVCNSSSYFKNIIVSKDCPYYAEHLLTEWNNEK